MSGRHHNHNYSGGIPLSVRDRYYAQDLGRDFWYQMDRLGLMAKAIYGKVPVLISGGELTQGSGLSLNIKSGEGLVEYTITVPDSFSSRPPTTRSYTLPAISVNWPDLASIASGSPNVATYSPVNDGSTVNYVKIAYAESGGNTRPRVKGSGSYNYELLPSYSIIVDNISPMANQVCLGTFTSNGTTYVFSAYSAHKVFMSSFNNFPKARWINVQSVFPGLSISGIGNPALATLNEYSVAYIDATLKSLRTYKQNDTGWTLVGSALSITGMHNPALTALSNVHIAFIDDGLKSLRVYGWDGATWTQIGSGLTITEILRPTITALNSTTVALFNGSTNLLRTYQWDGSVWSLVGTSLSIYGAYNPAITALNSTDIAFIDSDIQKLRTYRWNGVTWSQVGVDRTVSSIIKPALTALNNTDIVFTDGNHNFLRLYRWDGYMWTQIGTDYAISGSQSPAMCTLNGQSIAYIDATEELLKVYQYSYCFESPYHP